jgi:acyl-CoA thioesterase FadM
MKEYVATYRVHVYEVDAFNELTTSGLLRYLQQTASDASAAIGFDFEWYERAGTVWLIRRTTVERVAPAMYDDELSVRTWVSDVRRVRSERAYEAVRRRDGALIARGTTDWVYCDIARGMPTRVPDALQKALMPDGVEGRARRPPEWPDPPAAAFRTRRRVELSDLDSVAHVNNARYAAFLEQDLHDALAEHGWPIDPTSRDGHLRLSAIDLEYLEAAVYGDLLDGLVWTTAASAKRLECAHALLRHGRAAVRAHTAWEWSEGDLPGPLLAAAARFGGGR